MTSENYKDKDIESVELTYDEKNEVLRKALEKKKARIRYNKYMLELKENPKPKKYSSDDYWKIFQKRVLELEPEFQINKWNERIISALCSYFADDEDFDVLKEGFSRKKGIMLYGPYGCGKSTIMKAFRINQLMSYQCTSVLHLDSLFAQHGEKVVMEFIGYSDIPAQGTFLFHQKMGGYCFDDLGQEEDKKAHFSNKINVIGQILKRRYSSDMPGYCTHITTNADSNELGQMYPFLKSSGRLREMFNVLRFKPDAPNYRK